MSLLKVHLYEVCLLVCDETSHRVVENSSTDPIGVRALNKRIAL